MSAERGWIADPPPPPPKDTRPGEEFKWRLMMNAGQFSDKYKYKETPDQKAASCAHDDGVDE